MFSFIVIHRPEWDVPGGACTVDAMRVIDSWACTDKSLARARVVMVEQAERGMYAKYGTGSVEVVRTDALNRIPFIVGPRP